MQALYRSIGYPANTGIVNDPLMQDLHQLGRIGRMGPRNGCARAERHLVECHSLGLQPRMGVMLMLEVCLDQRLVASVIGSLQQVLLKEFVAVLNTGGLLVFRAGKRKRSAGGDGAAAIVTGLFQKQNSCATLRGRQRGTDKELSVIPAPARISFNDLPGASSCA